MPTYAILGATGSVGGSVLRVLLDKSANDPTIRIHAYCRSEEKLAKLNPQIVGHKAVRVFEGSLDDQKLLADCVRGTRAIFVAIAETGNKPGTTLAADTAQKVIAALKHVQDDASSAPPLPKLIVLSSASTEHRLMSDTPRWLLSVLYTAFSSLYDDLKAAERLYRAADLGPLTFIKPGALSEDEARGHVVSLDTASSPVSFIDLAGGMVDVADDADGRYDGIAVAVNAASKTAFPWQAPIALSKGLLCHFFPWLYPYIG